jgi:hypothetical protein
MVVHLRVRIDTSSIPPYQLPIDYPGDEQLATGTPTPPTPTPSPYMQTPTSTSTHIYTNPFNTPTPSPVPLNTPVLQKVGEPYYYYEPWRADPEVGGTPIGLYFNPNEVSTHGGTWKFRFGFPAIDVSLGEIQGRKAVLLQDFEQVVYTKSGTNVVEFSVVVSFHLEYRFMLPQGSIITLTWPR